RVAPRHTRCGGRSGASRRARRVASRAAVDRHAGARRAPGTRGRAGASREGGRAVHHRRSEGAYRHARVPAPRHQADQARDCRPRRFRAAAGLRAPLPGDRRWPAPARDLHVLAGLRLGGRAGQPARPARRSRRAARAGAAGHADQDRRRAGSEDRRGPHALSATRFAALGGVMLSALALGLYTRIAWPWTPLGWVALVPWLAVLDRTTSWRGGVGTTLLMAGGRALARVGGGGHALQGCPPAPAARRP